MPEISIECLSHTTRLSLRIGSKSTMLLVASGIITSLCQKREFWYVAWLATAIKVSDSGWLRTKSVHIPAFSKELVECLMYPPVEIYHNLHLGILTSFGLDSQIRNIAHTM